LVQQSELIVLRERVRELEEALDGSPETAIRFGLKKQLNSVFKVLLERDYLSKSSLETLMAVHGQNKEIYSHAAHNVLMWRLRKALAPYGVQVLTKTGLGYYLSSEDKAKIKQVMSDGL